VSANKLFRTLCFLQRIDPDAIRKGKIDNQSDRPSSICSTKSSRAIKMKYFDLIKNRQNFLREQKIKKIFEGVKTERDKSESHQPIMDA
jgi:hypothetical protein